MSKMIICFLQIKSYRVFIVNVIIGLHECMFTRYKQILPAKQFFEEIQKSYSISCYFFDEVCVVMVIFKQLFV